MSGALGLSLAIGRIHCFIFPVVGRKNMDDDFERHLDSDTLRFIRRKARQLAGRYGFQRHEAEDIQQSLILDCLERLARFNPQRGSRANFTRLIVKRSVATLIEARRSSTRGFHVRHVSLDSPINRNDSEASEFRDVISQHDCRGRMGRSLNRTEQRLIVKLDVERAIAALPPHLRQICQLLVVFDRIAQVAAVAGVSRATLHRRMRVIRVVFAQMRLSDYFPKSSARQVEGREEISSSLDLPGEQVEAYDGGTLQRGLRKIGAAK
jgi:RNA polymerase sigma factor (sigma-70 family)